MCRINEPCEEPARGLILQFVRSGVVKAEAKTSITGTYSVRLRPGYYGVKTRRHHPGAGLTPRVVKVPRARVARINFHLDTGIQ